MLRNDSRVPSFPPNLEDYAPWVAIHGLVAPYGECQCGCGQITLLANKSSRENGTRKGFPLRILKGHKLPFYHSLEEAFWGRVKKSEGCWLWTLKPTARGYADFTWGGLHYIAHRLSYELHFGPIPDNLLVCHECDVRTCVRPDHLFLGTHLDNTHDMIAKGRSSRMKLTEAKVRAIRDLAAMGKPQAEIAREFGVRSTSIWNILNGKTWRQVG